MMLIRQVRVVLLRCCCDRLMLLRQEVLLRSEYEVDCYNVVSKSSFIAIFLRQVQIVLLQNEMLLRYFYDK